MVRRKLFLFLGVLVLIAIALVLFLNYNRPANYNQPASYNQPAGIEDEKVVKDIILADIRKRENTERTNISFEKISITGTEVDVNIWLNWGPELCVGYNYKLSKNLGTWKIISVKQTRVC